AIRRWLGGAPERGSEGAMLRTIDRVRQTDQPRVVVLRLPMPLAAGFVILALVAGALAIGAGGSALLGVTAPTPSPTPSPTPTCAVEFAVTGRYPILLGHGFTPQTDVVLEIVLANGDHLTVTKKERTELHTDNEGRFGLTFTPLNGDVGNEAFAATAGGCTAS